jgi:hypothetical protein
MMNPETCSGPFRKIYDYGGYSIVEQKETKAVGYLFHYNMEFVPFDFDYED